MNKEELQFVKRCTDLSVQADRRDHVIYSDFLNMNEISLLYEKKADYSSAFSLYGGYEEADRRIAAFYPFHYAVTAEELKEQFPIACLQLTPVNKKYADEITHRDVLGAVMNLGIERKKIGDILLKDHQVYLFCHETISPLISQELSKIKHTMMRATIVSCHDMTIVPEYDHKEGFIASNRLDAIVAEVCKLSRSKAAEMILGERVFINGKMISNHNQKIDPGDILSLRGFGKIRFDDFISTTKKGRIRIAYSIYK